MARLGPDALRPTSKYRYRCEQTGVQTECMDRIIDEPVFQTQNAMGTQNTAALTY